MANKRKSIPKAVEGELLFKNNMTCAICRKSKNIQIHHIDENASNNNIDNLMVICLNCHGEIHKNGGMTKGYDKGVLIKYKKTREKINELNLNPPKNKEKKSALEKELFKFEIEKISYRILSLNDSDKDKIDEYLEYLYNIHLFKGYTNIVLDNLRNIIPSVSLIDKNKASIISKRIYEFFRHLVGPKIVPLNKKDESNLIKGIDILYIIGDFVGEYNKDYEIINNVADSLFNLGTIIINYNRKDLLKKLLENLKHIKRSCETTYENEKKLTKGINKIDKVIEKLSLSL